MYLRTVNNILELIPSVPTQYPALEPAWIIEGIVPLQKNRGDFLVSGKLWSRFHAHVPWATFKEFWSAKELVYDRRNAEAKRFFLKISSMIQRNTRRSFLSMHFIAKSNGSLTLTLHIMLPWDF